MKTIEIFDPAMCCPTGLCGTNINPELMRIAVVIETLKRQGVVVTRHNLRDEPQVYVSNKTVNQYLQKRMVQKHCLLLWWMVKLQFLKIIPQLNK